MIKIQNLKVHAYSRNSSKYFNGRTLHWDIMHINYYVHHHGVVLLQTHRIEQVNLPYGLTPTENGRAPTEIVVITVLVTPLITETVLSFWFVT